jgi:uncharacterized protein
MLLSLHCGLPAIMETTDTKHPDPMLHPCVIELRKMLQSVLGDDFVRLYHYGSRVEGGAEPDSDYDVLCVTKRPLSRQQKDTILDRQLDIEIANDVMLDLHFYSDEELRTPPISFTPYVRHVTMDGIVV